MITRRQTLLLQVSDLHAFRQVIRERANPESLIVVPTQSAGRQLERSASASRSLRCVNRDELYDALHARLPDAPRRLTAIERDVFAQASARAVANAGAPLAFQLRPGLVAEMLRFYDQLRRQAQTVDRFEELIADAIGDGESDAGVLRMRQQTRFLADTFREYERRVRASNACDEHMLREQLAREPARNPIRHVIVTVADWIADDHGLYVADFDLLSRLPGLESIDLVTTESVLRSGFRERLDRWLPGIDETVYPESTPPFPRPVLLTPASSELWFTYRDREEELVGVSRALETGATAVVYKRPLPYLYLARDVLGDASIAYHVDDALPLAIEPTAAAFDLILDAAAAEFTRDSLVGLLRCPHLDFAVDRHAVRAFDRHLSDARFLGGIDPLERLDWPDAAYRAAVQIARELAPLRSPRPASEQIRVLLAFWTAHARLASEDDPFAGRERRSRAAIVETLEALGQVHAGQDDPTWSIDDLAIAVRRTIETQTFVPESAPDGVHLLDDHAAVYGAFDHVFIVGMVENEWPVKPRRNIFYPPGLLNALGWPTERDRQAAADARFVDLVASASRRTAISTFTLDDDALVSPSLQLDAIARARLPLARLEPPQALPIPDAMAAEADSGTGDAASARRRAWEALRAARPGFDVPAYHGIVGEQPVRAWSVSALETYLGCPFRFFAQHVLGLTDDPDDEETIDPRRQGLLVHEVFERFFREWQAQGHGTITATNLDVARVLFERIVDAAVGTLSPAEGGLERTRLVGSPAAAGLGEAVFRMEAERPARVVERLIEHRLDGVFTIAADGASRRIRLRGKADRIDLLEDGTFRLIDYKLGWPPERTRALQLPIYSVCAEQRLTSYRGRRWRFGEAAYLAFKGPRRVVPLCAPGAREAALADAQQRLADTVAAIERGDFPPTPDDTYRCETCSFASVCRKDYVGDV